LHAVHAHINLLGWATMALAGLIYTVFPAAGASKLAKVHFWLQNISLPIMMGALTMLLLGNPKVIPILATAEFIAAAGVITFAINIFLNLKKT
jgi:cbb3-type cytochrome oxidase subunit 1